MSGFKENATTAAEEPARHVGAPRPVDALRARYREGRPAAPITCWSALFSVPNTGIPSRLPPI